jgi:hypothetical protein
LATEIRQIIVRYWQQSGQTKILEINRELGTTLKPNAPEVELKTFVHPSAQQPKKEPAAATPVMPAAQAAKPGKLSRQFKGDQSNQQQTLAANPAKDIPEKEVVAGVDAAPAVIDQPITNPLVKLTRDQVVALKQMTPVEIVSTYGIQWIKEKLTAHRLEFLQTDSDTRLAAILKNKTK